MVYFQSELDSLFSVGIGQYEAKKETIFCLVITMEEDSEASYDLLPRKPPGSISRFPEPWQRKFYTNYYEFR